MDATISEGNHVVLSKSFDSGNMKIVHVMRNTLVYYGKLHFNPSPLIGSKFGSVFEIRDGSMFEVDDFDRFDEELSQKVSNNLLTFNDKSQFSQEKIIRKKKKQNHANIVTVIRPTLVHINEMFYARDKIGGLRLDILSQIMTMANIQNGSKCMLLDHNLGLLTSAVMSRILPCGFCIQLAPDNEVTCTTRKTVSMLNLDEDLCSEKLCAITIRDLYKVIHGLDRFEYENFILKAKGEDQVDRLSDMHDDTTLEAEELATTTKNDISLCLLRKDSNREVRHKERIKAVSYLKDRSLDSMILVSQSDHPLHILKMSYPFLALSGQFVIYSDTVEPLLECHQYLKSNSMAVSLKLSESWLRYYQVLPDRTRPEMNVSGYGGYLLSGIKALTGSHGFERESNHGKSAGPAR